MPSTSNKFYCKGAGFNCPFCDRKDICEQSTSKSNKEDILNKLLNDVNVLQDTVTQLKAEINQLKAKETLFGPSNIHYPEHSIDEPIMPNNIVKCFNVYGDMYEKDLLTGEIVQRTHGV